MAATTTTVPVKPGAWVLIGSTVSGKFTLQNLGRAGSGDIKVKSGATNALPTDDVGHFVLGPAEALEDKTIAILWPGSSTDQYLFAFSETPVRVSISHA